MDGGGALDGGGAQARRRPGEAAAPGREEGEKNTSSDYHVGIVIN